MRRNMRRFRQQAFTVPDKLAVAAKAQLLTQPHNGCRGDKCRLRQLTDGDLAYQQRMLCQMRQHPILRAG